MPRTKKTIPRVLADKIELVPWESVQKYPGNPRIGDIPAIRESLRNNDLFRPLIVQRSTGYILDGNHTWEAAGLEGMPKVPVVFVDVDDRKAKRMVLVANRAADLATYDNTLLAEVLASLEGPIGTGYSQDDYDALVRAVESSNVDVPMASRATLSGLDAPMDLGVDDALDKFGVPGDDGIERDGALELAEEQIAGAFTLKNPDEVDYEKVLTFGIPPLRPDMLVQASEVDPNLLAWAGSATKDWPDPDQWWLYNVGVDSTSGMNDVSKCIVSFYTWDHYFESWWVYPDRWVAKLLNSGIKYAVTPDWSLWSSKPLAVSLWNVYRSRFIGRYMQEAGIKVIPNVSWPFKERGFYDQYVRGTLPKDVPVISFQLQTFDQDMPDADRDWLKEQVEHVITGIDPDLVVVYTGKQGRELMNEITVPNKVQIVSFRTEALAAKAAGKSKKKTL